MTGSPGDVPCGLLITATPRRGRGRTLLTAPSVAAMPMRSFAVGRLTSLVSSLRRPRPLHLYKNVVACNYCRRGCKRVFLFLYFGKLCIFCIFEVFFVFLSPNHWEIFPLENSAFWSQFVSEIIYIVILEEKMKLFKTCTLCITCNVA